MPYAVGETFRAVALSTHSSADEDAVAEPDSEDATTETFYLGTNHGIYEMRQDPEGQLSRVNITNRVGITNSALLGRPIQALAASENVLYAGTPSGLYRYYKVPPADDENEAHPTRIWHKVKGTPFDAQPVQAINVPHWDDTQIYVGTKQGLYTSNDSGETWNPVAPTIYAERIRQQYHFHCRYE